MGGRDYRTRSQVAYDKGIEKGEFIVAFNAIKKGLLSLDYFRIEEKWSPAKLRRFEKFQNEQTVLI